MDVPSTGMQRRLARLGELRHELEHGNAADAPMSPAAEWVDTGTELLLLLDLPGVDVGALQVEHGEGFVTVRGERPAQPGSLHSERPSGAFARTLPLPLPVQAEEGGAGAELRAGVLTLRFRKARPVVDSLEG